MDERFFITESLRMARESLSYLNFLQYLRGMVKTIGDVDDVADLRGQAMSMVDCDAQLELIASGQLKLNLETNGRLYASARATAKKGRRR